MLAFSNKVGKKILIEKKSFKRLLYGCFPVHWVTASAKYPLFVTSTSTTKSYSNVIFWRLKFSAQKLRIVARSCFWRSQTVRCDWIDLLLMQQTIYSKCCWKSEAVTQQFLWKQKWCSVNFRSNRSQMIFKIGAIKNITNITGKSLRWSIVLIKLYAWINLKTSI